MMASLPVWTSGWNPSLKREFDPKQKKIIYLLIFGVIFQFQIKSAFISTSAPTSAFIYYSP